MDPCIHVSMSPLWDGHESSASRTVGDHNSLRGHVKVGERRMLYICCRETDGYQQVSNECAPATTVHCWTGRGRNQARHTQGPPRTWADTEAGGVGQAVWVEPGASSRSAASTRSRGFGGFVPSPGNGRCVLIA